MKRSHLIFAMLLSSVASVAQGPLAIADQAVQPRKVKQLTVRSVADVKSVFGLAAAQGRQAIEISCSPASSSWCAKDFVTACDNAKGGMSTDPDGGVTCSLPQHE